MGGTFENVATVGKLGATSATGAVEGGGTAMGESVFLRQGGGSLAVYDVDKMQVEVE